MRTNSDRRSQVLFASSLWVEFASKIIRVGTGSRRKRIKLQLWDTAGTERFRSVSRSYYRGAAGAVLVYDITSHKTFTGLPTFMNDARALASPNLTVLLVGNKADLANEGSSLIDTSLPPATPSSISSKGSSFPFNAGGSVNSNTGMGLGSQLKATIAPDGREVSAEEASKWASSANIPVSVEVSALSGDNVEEVFNRLARMILTKIEVGEIDPDDPMSGIQYGDSGNWNGGASDVASVKSGMTIDEGGARRRRRPKSKQNWGLGGMREWEEVFTLSGNRRRRGGCC
ncbi:GTP-binding ypt4 [Hyphodiscus hymeniophilus]|uniref:GTP-binding ypt4 n=1 Tax=Hyphodiscus hymeniophilus TaxID=353542 RepID=A0A9P6SQV4_9HELO|nr:GTP-binding ypt4 [Hyphodiscus hymeniophilus]